MFGPLFPVVCVYLFCMFVAVVFASSLFTFVPRANPPGILRRLRSKTPEVGSPTSPSVTWADKVIVHMQQEDPSAFRKLAGKPPAELAQLLREYLSKKGGKGKGKTQLEGYGKGLGKRHETDGQKGSKGKGRKGPVPPPASWTKTGLEGQEPDEVLTPQHGRVHAHYTGGHGGRSFYEVPTVEKVSGPPRVPKVLTDKQTYDEKKDQEAEAKPEKKKKKEVEPPETVEEEPKAKTAKKAKKDNKEKASEIEEEQKEEEKQRSLRRRRRRRSRLKPQRRLRRNQRPRQPRKRRRMLRRKLRRLRRWQKEEKEQRSLRRRRRSTLNRQRLLRRNQRPRK